MKQNIAKKWVKALRSGKYKQGFGELKSSVIHPKHCCLGVLCELYIQDTGKGIKDFNSGKQELPSTVMRWAGFKETTSNLGCVKFFTQNEDLIEYYDSLADLNDDGFSFEYIAKIIDKYYKEI